MENTFRTNSNVITGVNWAPVLHVICEVELLDENAAELSFEVSTIAKTQLKGFPFDADAKRVHRMVRRFIQREHAKVWMRHQVSSTMFNVICCTVCGLSQRRRCNEEDW